MKKLVKRKYNGCGYGIVEGNGKLEPFHSFDLEFEGGIKIKYNCKEREDVMKIEGIKINFVCKQQSLKPKNKEVEHDN